MSDQVLNSAREEKRETDLDRAVLKLRDVTIGLQNNLGALSAKLKPVLNDIKLKEPTKDIEKEPRQVQTTELGGLLDEEIMKLERVNRNIKELLGLVEL